MVKTTTVEYGTLHHRFINNFLLHTFLTKTHSSKRIKWIMKVGRIGRQPTAETWYAAVLKSIE